MSEYKILFLGDIVGRPGRKAVLEALPTLVERLEPLFVIVNGENSANGIGITPDIGDELLKAGIDSITLGNHAFKKKEIYDYLDSGVPIVRPANIPSSSPGTGVVTIEKDGVKLAVINLCGRIFLDGYDDPFREIDKLLAQVQTNHVLIDFHAEATSEKIAFGHHVDGRATAVIGTHTHVTTADEHVMAGETAFITDVGMCGPLPSVIGMDKDIIVERFRTSMPIRFEVAKRPGVISGVVICVRRDTGRAVSIGRVS